jgi:hypothetical protein
MSRITTKSNALLAAQLSRQQRRAFRTAGGKHGVFCLDLGKD